MVSIETLEEQVAEHERGLSVIDDALSRGGGQRNRLEASKDVLTHRLAESLLQLERARARAAHEATDEYKQERERALREVEKLRGLAESELDALLSSVLTAGERASKYYEFIESADKLKREYVDGSRLVSATSQYARAVSQLVARFADFLGMENSFSKSALSEKYCQRFDAMSHRINGK